MKVMRPKIDFNQKYGSEFCNFILRRSKSSNKLITQEKRICLLFFCPFNASRSSNRMNKYNSICFNKRLRLI